MANPGLKSSESGYAIFLIAGKEYGISLETLASIINPLEDFSQRFAIKIENNSIFLNKEEIPLINLYELLNIKFPPYSKDTRIMVIDIQEHTVAFYVEKVKEFIIMDIRNRLQLEFIPTLKEPFIKLQMKYGEKIILLPDFESILVEIM